MNRYRPQIDALRFFAILAVFYKHLWHETSSAGHIGVRLFFVISGYLITTVLLTAGARIRSGATGVAQEYLGFARNRALRIWPIYFVPLTIAVLANMDDIRSVAIWHYLFLSNMLVVHQGAWTYWLTNHLWTLAVEQQFYFVWPFLILLAPRRLAAVVAIGAVLAGVGWRVWATLAGHNEIVVLNATPGSLDALGIGALLACWLPGRRVAWLWPAALAALGVCLGAQVWLDGYGPGLVRDVLLETIWPFALVLTVGAAAQGVTGWGAVVLEDRRIVYLGRISYGLYLFFPFVGGAWEKLLTRWGYVGAASGGDLFLLTAVSTIAVATVSWRYFEQPIMRGRWLPPVPAEAAAAPAASGA